jgi:hypothetical protein
MLHMLIANQNVQGGLYYWSSTNDPNFEGLWRFDFGAVGASAQRYYGQSDAGHCVACHVLTRDGARIAITYDGGNGVAGELDVATKQPIISMNQGIFWNFLAYDPDGTRMVTTHDGAMTLRDAMTGAALGAVPVGGRASQPDWSPDGLHVVYALGNPGRPDSDWQVHGGDIDLIDYNAGAWGAPRTLVRSMGDDNYYPQFSPDGNWIIFNRAQNDPNPGQGSYNNPSAELWTVKADGSGQPIHLAAAQPESGRTDSWPRFSPFIQNYGPPEQTTPITWVTVSSKRAYGVELAAGDHPQLWMFAFSPERAAMGMDPSWPAFWLPFQDLQTSNHIAQWTTRIVPVP